MHGTLDEVDFERRRLIDDQGREWQMRRVRQSADSFGRRFSVIFQDAAMHLALKGERMRPTTWRCLMLALADLEFERWRAVRPVEWAELLKVTRSAISKALAQLVAEGLLEGGPRTGYRLTPVLGWRGTPAGYHRQIAAFVKAGGIGDEVAAEVARQVAAERDPAAT